MGRIHDTSDPSLLGLRLETRRESFVIYNDHERIELDYTKIGAVRLLLDMVEWSDACVSHSGIDPSDKDQSIRDMLVDRLCKVFEIKDDGESVVVKTFEQIAELKRQWLADGCWDIEDTPGFEEHRDELIAWRADHEAKAEAARLVRVGPVLERRSDSRWERAAMACLAGGDDSQEAIARADRFVALVQEKWVP